MLRDRESFKATGSPSPPELIPGFDVWLDAFWELSTDRRGGDGAGPIPAASIARHTAGWAADEADLFRVCIRAMDSVFLAFAAGQEPDVDEPAEAVRKRARDAFRAAFGGGARR